jgi:hypothetical protein
MSAAKDLARASARRVSTATVIQSFLSEKKLTHAPGAMGFAQPVFFLPWVQGLAPAGLIAMNSHC